MVDWLKEATARQDDLLKDLISILEIPSERDIEHATADQPLGPGPAKALAQMLAIAERDGFVTKNVENVAGRVQYGAGQEIFGLLGHMDVVPAGPGWQTNPYQPVIKDGNLIARGSSDDKGPAMAAYYALKIIKELGLPVAKQIHYIFGTDEESEWVGIDRYLEVEPTPDFGFSPDAEFPIINGEKGIASFKLTFAPGLTTTGATSLCRFSSGIRANMVPQTATAIVKGHDLDQLGTALTNFAAENDLVADAEIQDEQVILTLTGKGAHAQEPRDGVNAGTYLALFLSQQTLDEAGQQYVNTISNWLHLDSRGKKLGIAHHDELMGELTASPDIFTYTAGQHNSVLINVRYPQGTDAERIRQQIATTIAAANVTCQIDGHAQEPHYVSGDDPLVKTLLAVYERQTGLPGHEQVIGGGTYGRILERGVAFGAQFPGQPNVMHQANEFMPIADIIKATAIYAEAIYELVRP
ncbi:dipeptidase PepV [Lapidilactobacillus luobeiensis]|uniref:dipeptidase PepV n=1 Tax=Lapidilactobacillus luobeiensis TaxID=2950371 RepID=UPI0021C44F7A|nr:dipeptidase PepV [Lapidilactobacillus luobeiensis]